jgi:hypothetical protein
MSGLTKFEKLGPYLGGKIPERLEFETENTKCSSIAVCIELSGLSARLTNDDDICLSQFSLEEFVWTP